MSKKQKNDEIVGKLPGGYGKSNSISEIKIKVKGPTASGKSTLLDDLRKFLVSHPLAEHADITMKGVQE